MQFAQSMMGGGSSGGGQSEWGDLAKLGQMASAAGGGDHNKAEPSGLMSMLGGGGGSSGGGGLANQAMGMMGGGGGGANAGAGNVDTGVLHKLVGVFNQETGTQYNPDDDSHNNIMSSIASKVTGTNMPPSLVSKLIKWKLQGMF